MKILDLSKYHMYDIWYTLLKPIFGHALTLIFMDTDSFVFSIIGMNEQTYNETILKNQRVKNFLDFSKFSKDHILYNTNNQECGKMKSERKGKIINYAISLRSKMYYLDNIDKNLKELLMQIKIIS